jgi:predicted AAA+ superfamily ATPase
MDEIEDTLLLLNQWWKTKEVSRELAKPYKRAKFLEIEKYEKYRQIIILSGLRRVGKTTLLYQAIAALLKKEEPGRVLYFSFDRKAEDMLKIFEAYSRITGMDYKKEKIFVFMDEITKHSGWADSLKIIYDSHPDIKFYLSSSSSINLEEEAIKNLAGRYFLISIQPLSFKEYLQLKGKEQWLQKSLLYEAEIKKEFRKYLLRSFPETINWQDELIIKDYLRTTILDKIIKSDLPERFRNINKTLLFNLLELVYKEPGYYLGYDSLSKSLGISKKTLFKHIYYLEFCYLVRIIRNFRVSTLSTTRKLQRAYPYWWSLAYCYSDKEDKIMESLIASTLDLHHYWRDAGKEIDFLQVKNKLITPIEVKNKEKLDQADMSHMLFFMKKNKLKEGIIAYQGPEKEEIIEKHKIRLVPFWKLLLE